jgi:hypothetical protein
MEIGRLERLPVRDLWKSEARDFTTWLADNIEVLSDAVGLSLTVTAKEKAVGSFWLDLVAEDGNGQTVVIENQLEKTDHDHLGKVLTYLSNLEAKTAIWVSAEPREEHIAAVKWLNEFTPDDVAFILVKVEGVKIGESAPAASFTVVAQPTSQGRAIGEVKKGEAERHVKRREFWTQLLQVLNARGTSMHSSLSAGPEYWLSASRKGVQYSYLIFIDKAALELYIDTGSQDKNKAIFDRLYCDKERVEEEIGGSPEWNRLDDKRASAIRLYVDDHGLFDGDHWDDTQQKMVVAMDRFSKAFMTRLDKG